PRRRGRLDRPGRRRPPTALGPRSRHRRAVGDLHGAGRRRAPRRPAAHRRPGRRQPVLRHRRRVRRPLLLNRWTANSPVRRPPKRSEPPCWWPSSSGQASSPNACPGDGGLELLENSLATGAGLMALILAFGAVSGAHFNPVVSLADRVLGGLTTRELAAYL